MSQKSYQRKEPRQHQQGLPRRHKNNSTNTPMKSLISDNDDKGEGISNTAMTRICIKNLPANFQEQDLRQFLMASTSKTDEIFLKITDCKVLRHADTGKSRRMAFVGLETAPQATACVKLLNHSYCRTSKLVVEFARRRQFNDNTSATLDHEDDEKTKKETKKQQNERDEIAKGHTVKNDPKLQEFLSVMGVKSSNDNSKDQQQPSSSTSSKFWANDDNMNDQQQQIPHDTSDKYATDSTSTSDSSESDSDDDDDDEDDNDDADPLMKQNKQKAPQSSGLSDMDFLRSKQVEITDLKDNDSDKDDKNKNDSDTDSTTSSSSGSTNSTNSSSLNPSKSVATPSALQTGAESHDGNKSTPMNARDDDNAGKVGESDDIDAKRLFIRNLPFSTTEDDLRSHLESAGHSGAIQQVHIPVDDLDRPKGFAFITFNLAENAAAVLADLDGTDFRGRLMHILPAKRQPQQQQYEDSAAGGGTYKQQRELERKKSAANNQAGWFSSFVRGDAVVDNVATRLGVSKGDVLAVKDGLSAGNAAVRLALGETAIIEENLLFFAKQGIDLDTTVVGAAGSNNGNKDEPRRSKTRILVKNLPHDTTKEELTKIFGSAATANATQQPLDIHLAPSRTIAVVDYPNRKSATGAFRRLAYRRFKSVPLYLEWAPLLKDQDPTAQKSNVSTSESKPTLHDENNGNSSKIASDVDNDDDDDNVELANSTTMTVYVKNLNFATSEKTLRDVFLEQVKDVRAVRIPKKVAPMKQQGNGGQQQQSMGFGFVEFGSQSSVRKVLRTLQGRLVDGHALELKASVNNKNGQQMPLTKSKQNLRSSKLIVRNVPFQATRKEILQLFGSFGQLKKVRLPKKFDGTHRGFAFVEYVAAKEADAAVKALSRTHLYGRHLVLEWAREDNNDNAVGDSKTNGNEQKRHAEEQPRMNKKIKFDY